MADSAREARAKALEEKKRRLEELKAKRRNRAQVSEDVRPPSNINDYIDGLLNEERPGAAVPVTVPTTVEAKETSTVVTGPLENGGVANDSSQPQDDNVIGVPRQPESAPAAQAPVKVVETFAMGTQTEDDDFPPDLADEDEQIDDKDQGDAKEKSDREGDAVDANKKDETETTIIEPTVLSTEETEVEVSSVPFSSFLNTASKKVERMLGTPVLADLLVNYVGEDDDADKKVEKTPSDGSRFVSAHQTFECPKWTATRDVTDLDWSPLHRELMLSSYHMQSSSTSTLSFPSGSAALSAVSPDDSPSASLAPRSGELQSDGLALVWSLAMPTRPEHIFTCGSPILTTRFHPTEAPLIVGGCYSGQLVVWDIRAGRLPVQRSSLTTTPASTGNDASSKGHAHPICSMEVIEGGSGLVTAATDGRVNFWSLANLRDAVESLTVDGNISCLAVAPESNTLLCGDESGSIHTIQNSSSVSGGGGTTNAGPRSSKRPVRKLAPVGDDSESGGHFGMVTSVSAKPLKAGASRAGLSKGFLRGSGGLVLSSGVDWTTKLWAPAYADKPLLSFVSHSYDYMVDVQWSPTHPSLFATASSNGSLGLWNLATSLDDPISGSEGIVVEPDATSGRGLNKLKWSSDGRRILAASADRVHVLSMSEDALRQKGDEDARMMNGLSSRGLLLEEG